MDIPRWAPWALGIAAAGTGAWWWNRNRQEQAVVGAEHAAVEAEEGITLLPGMAEIIAFETTAPGAPTMADYEASIQQAKGIRLGQYFNLSEFLTSGTARSRKIPNMMPPDREGELIANLRALVQNTLDPIRVNLGVPVTISGGWRSPLLNDAIGGSRLCKGHGFPNPCAPHRDCGKAPDSVTALALGCGSQHLLGEGVDIRVKGYVLPSGKGDSKRLAADILQLKQAGLINYDQMVWYDPDQSGHVHLSWTRRRAPRGEVQRKMASGYVSQLPTVA